MNIEYQWDFIKGKNLVQVTDFRVLDTADGTATRAGLIMINPL